MAIKLSPADRAPLRVAIGTFILSFVALGSLSAALAARTLFGG